MIEALSALLAAPFIRFLIVLCAVAVIVAAHANHQE
jgi:hypothetical protein